MNKPNDIQIKKVLSGSATQEEAKLVSQWFSTPEGMAYLSDSMNKDFLQINPELADLYVDHPIPSDEIYRRIQKIIQRKKMRRIWLRVAAVAIPVMILIGLYSQVSSRVDLFGNSEYQEVIVAKGERLQMMFQDGSRVYINSDSKLRFPKMFALGTRDVYLQGEAYFKVAKDKHRPFIVHLGGPDVHVVGTEFNVQNYPEEREIVVSLDEGRINMVLPHSDNEYRVMPGEKFIYDKEKKSFTISRDKNAGRERMWKQNILSFKDTPMAEVLKTLERWYNVDFKVKDTSAMKYVYTLTSNKESLDDVLLDLEKITPVHFKYDKIRKEVSVWDANKH